VHRTRPLLGTFVEITATGRPAAAMHAAIDAAFAAVARVHRLMSFQESTSDVSRVNRHAATTAVVVHPWTYAVLTTAADLFRRSDGLFDVTVAPELQALGVLPRAVDETRSRRGRGPTVPSSFCPATACASARPVSGSISAGSRRGSPSIVRSTCSETRGYPAASSTPGAIWSASDPTDIASTCAIREISAASWARRW
jgi:hypothetical protein